MFHRIIKPLKSNSFFIFGARGTGKSTFLQMFFKDGRILWFDLLDPKTEDLFLRNPAVLAEQAKAQIGSIDWIIIDEIQKQPKLLDVVHSLIESTPIKFSMTGSSARKLKKGGANLLAGRAFVNHLFSLTHVELGDSFDLGETLHWGTLPKIF
ncbi:MAG: AAA family ATPase, partial [Deltaproteobacteria bacterium]